jgi:hypothetical protein
MTIEWAAAGRQPENPGSIPGTALDNYFWRCRMEPFGTASDDWSTEASREQKPAAATWR